MTTRTRLTQLANTAQRNAEKYERIAGRHDDAAERLEQAAERHRPGSRARRRADGYVRRAQRRAERARRKAERQRQREADFRQRLRALPPDPPRPPTRRWVPQTPWGKLLAYLLIAGGFATGIAIGGSSGFDPFDDESEVTIEVAAAPPGAGQAVAGANQPAGVDPVDAPAETTSAGLMPGEDTTSSSADDTAIESAVEDEAHSVESTPVPTSEPTPEPESEPEPERESETDLFSDCVVSLQQYPELLELYADLAERCAADPETALTLMDPLLAALMVQPNISADLADCFMYLFDYPELLIIDPDLDVLCIEDTDGAREVISEILTELGVFG